MHLFEALSFSTDHPATIVGRTGGDVLDKPLPAPLPADATPADGVRLAALTSSNRFGFLLMERRTERRDPDWKVTMFSATGAVLTTCELVERRLSCSPLQ